MMFPSQVGIGVNTRPSGIGRTILAQGVFERKASVSRFGFSVVSHNRTCVVRNAHGVDHRCRNKAITEFVCSNYYYGKVVALVKHA